jgi:hypothetical protein
MNYDSLYAAPGGLPVVVPIPGGAVVNMHWGARFAPILMVLPLEVVE